MLSLFLIPFAVLAVFTAAGHASVWLGQRFRPIGDALIAGERTPADRRIYA